MEQGYSINMTDNNGADRQGSRNFIFCGDYCALEQVTERVIQNN